MTTFHLDHVKEKFKTLWTEELGTHENNWSPSPRIHCSAQLRYFPSFQYDLHEWWALLHHLHLVFLVWGHWYLHEYAEPMWDNWCSVLKLDIDGCSFTFGSAKQSKRKRFVCPSVEAIWMEYLLIHQFHEERIWKVKEEAMKCVDDNV